MPSRTERAPDDLVATVHELRREATEASQEYQHAMMALDLAGVPQADAELERFHVVRDGLLVARIRWLASKSDVTE